MRTKKNQEIIRYAELADGLVLKFYKAELVSTDEFRVFL